MNHLVTIVMAVALFGLALASVAPIFGITLLEAPRYISGGLGLTGVLLLIIMGIGGLVYWAGRR